MNPNKHVKKYFEGIKSISDLLIKQDIEYLAKEGRSLVPNVYPVPKEIDRQVGKLKLESMGIQIDSLTSKQQEYLDSWESGT